MLLYHFPLNTQESIENFTNKGFGNVNDILLTGGFVSANQGKLSQNALYNYIDNAYNPIEILLPQNGWSVAFRVKVDGTPAQDWSAIFQLFSKLTTAGFSGLLFHNGGFQFSAINIFNVDSEWHDVVITQTKNNNILLFHNGIFSAGYNTNINVFAIGLFGRYYNRPNSAKAFYQDIRIYDYALSQAEINEYSRALVVHYPLQGNELNGSVLKDVSGFGNDMVLQQVAGVGYPIEYQQGGNRGNTWTWNNKVYLLYKNNLSLGSNYTFTFWYKSKDSIISTRREFFYNNSIEINERYGVIGFGEYGSQPNRVSIPDSKGSLYFCAFTYNGSKAQSYLNGEFYAEKNLSLSSFTELYFGCKNNISTGAFLGNISDVRIYATVLSAEDIKNLYNSPISISKQHQTMAFEFNENPLYPSKYWRTPTYAEMNYILNTRSNAANLRTLGRVEISSGTYRNGLFLLPDDFVTPSGITVTITTANYTTNSYTLAQFKQLESVGVVFLPETEIRNGTTYEIDTLTYYSLANEASADRRNLFRFYLYVGFYDGQKMVGQPVRLCRTSSKGFSISSTTKIDFAPANLQYHCTQHIWRFAEHSYDIIGAANANISDSYNGWIDLFGYGTSGVNYSPTLHTTINSDYASGDIANTDNDWGINEIQSYDYNVKNFALNKNGILQHNELRENDSDVNGCYNNKLITNELIEN